MKTKFRSLGIAFVLSIIVIGVNATELKSTVEIEPALKLETWMTDFNLFEPNKVNSIAGTVVEIAVSNPDFSTLVEAVTKANLVVALSAEGPFTVFAPTNEAFEKLFTQLGVKSIQDLSAEQLTPILTYHVIRGKVMSADLSNTAVATLNGKNIKINLSEGVYINNSKVIKADIQGTNGVVHVIDKVLIPE